MKALIGKMKHYKSVKVTFMVGGESHTVKMFCDNLEMLIKTGRALEAGDFALRSRDDQQLKLNEMKKSVKRVTAKHIVKVTRYNDVLYTTIKKNPYRVLDRDQTLLLDKITELGPRTLKLNIHFKGKQLNIVVKTDRFVDFMMRNRPLEPADLIFSKRGNERFLLDIGADPTSNTPITMDAVQQVIFRKDVLYTNL